MFGLLARILLVVGGAITSWFVANDAVDFAAIQMTVAIVMFGLAILVAAFWPTAWIRKLIGR